MWRKHNRVEKQRAIIQMLISQVSVIHLFNLRVIVKSIFIYNFIQFSPLEISYDAKKSIAEIIIGKY